MVRDFVIDRSTWERGTGGAQLLRESDRRLQCCIGLYLTACGMPDDALLDQAQPEDVGDEIPEGAAWLIRESLASDGWADSCAAGQLIEVNDDPKIEDKEREVYIADVFDQHGIRVSFVDPSPSESTGEKT